MGNKGSKGEKKPKKTKKGKDAVSSASDDDEDPNIFGGRVTVEDFDLLKVIGKGSFGKVMQVRKKDTGQIYAMKILKKDMLIERNQVAHTMAERDILQRIQHPFIVNLNFAFQTDDKLYMVLDYINGGELFFHLKKEGRFSDVRVRQYSAEIVAALAHLHSFDIIYRDLKPENLLLDSDGHIKITDFGLSKQFKTADEKTETFCGTPEYLAPEILMGQGHGKPVDWWSLGTLMFEMLTGLPPFYSNNVNTMYQKILTGTITYPEFIADEAKSILGGFLTRGVPERLGTNSSADVKSHVYFAGLDWEKLERREYPPAFVPPVKEEADTSQIDTVFLAEAPVDTPVERHLPVAAGADGFGGFTFVPESALESGAK